MSHAVVYVERPSPRVMGKLRKGMPVRIRPKMSGEGVSLIVSADKYNHITRAFDKGKAYTVSLTPDELVANQNPPEEVAPQMEGGSIFDKMKKGLKKVGKALKPVAKEILIPAGKELAKKGVKELAKMAPVLGATALSGLATLSGNPELIPLASAVGSELGKQAGSYGSKQANKRIDSFHPLGAGLGMEGGRIKEPPSRSPSIDPMLVSPLARANMAYHLAGAHGAEVSGMFLKEQTPLHGHGLYGGGLYASGRGLYASGEGLYAGGRTRGAGVKEKSSVGIHGNLLGHGMPPALQSQPLSANFQFSSRLPPAYKALNTTP
jgi:hypothetical protein